jgi:hypothetical protein
VSSKLDYKEMVKEAELAVASIKDGELKGIAFGKILDTLLGRQGTGKEPSPSKGKPKVQRANSAGKASKAKGGPMGYIEELITDGFFKTPKTLAAIRAELGNGGHHIPVTSLSRPVMILCQRRRLRRQRTKDGTKQVFTYSNW